MRVSRNSEAAYHALNVASNVIICSVFSSISFMFHLFCIHRTLMDLRIAKSCSVSIIIEELQEW